ncbi:hypothetical protein MARI_08060 [Marinobacter sp. JH2]|nr:hypothetical protein MARI_08060 [Marinobacter sp. JH2]
MACGFWRHLMVQEDGVENFRYTPATSCKEFSDVPRSKKFVISVTARASS